MGMNIKKWMMLICMAVFMMISGMTVSAESTVTVRCSGYSYFDSANSVIDMVNEERAKAGLGALVSNPQIQIEALIRATEISLYYNGDHYRPNGTKGYDIISNKKKVFGENIAAGQASAASVMSAWMASTGHYKNIMNPDYKQIGVACFLHNGTRFWVQLFNGDTTSGALQIGTVGGYMDIEILPSLLNLSFESSALTVAENETKNIVIYQKNAGSLKGIVRADSPAFSWGSSGDITLSANSSGATKTVTGKCFGTGESGSGTIRLSYGSSSITETVTVTHKPGALSCTEGQYCTECGVQVQEAPGHKKMYSRTQCTDGLFCAREGCGVRIAPPGHTLREPATCTTVGRCLICDTTMQDALGHDFVGATCMDYGTCSRCGLEGWEEGEHVWGEWKRVAKATTTSPEKQQRTCTLCYWGAEIRYVGEKLPSSGSGSSGSNSSGNGSSAGNSSGGSSSSSQKKVTSVTIKGKTKLLTGKSTKLTVSVLPSGASNKNVYWSSSNPKYATVSQSGVVTAKSAGAGKKVTITAVAADGSGKWDSHTITIKGAVKKIKLKASKTTLKAGKKLTVKATVTVGKGGSRALKWSSSKKKYATVSSKGVVTAKKAGKGKTVTITARAKDGSGKKATIKIRIR